jgi:integrase
LAGSHFVEFNGRPVKSVKTGFNKAVALARLSGEGSKMVPHTLRHTAATWLVQRGVPAWQAAGYLGMSIEMIERVYGHHSPEHLRKAAEAITRKAESVSVVVSVVGDANAKSKRR